MRNKLFAMLSALIVTMTLSACGAQESTAVKESAASEDTTVSSEKITEAETTESEVQARLCSISQSVPSQCLTGKRPL